MVLPVKLHDVIEATECSGPELSHYLDKRTGEVLMITDEQMRAAEEDQLLSDYAEWQRDGILKAREILKSDDFVELPNQFDLHEYRIMENFCLDFEDRPVGEQLLRLIKGGGAFKRFKNALYTVNAENAWYAYRRRELEKFAIEWLEEEEIGYTREEEIQASGDLM